MAKDIPEQATEIVPESHNSDPVEIAREFMKNAGKSDTIITKDKVPDFAILSAFAEKYNCKGIKRELSELYIHAPSGDGVSRNQGLEASKALLQEKKDSKMSIDQVLRGAGAPKGGE